MAIESVCGNTRNEQAYYSCPDKTA